MDRLMDILRRAMEMVERFRSMEGEMPQLALIVFAVLLVFGALNCLLGYRLLRFWMMLIGFVCGAGGAFFAMRELLEIPFSQQRAVYLGSMLGAGVFLAVLLFWLYRAGIFFIAMAMGMSLSIYLLHPTSSATFYLCILIGIGVGAAAIRFEKQVIIILSSSFGGILAGYSLARLLRLDEYPYGILLCVLFALAGILIQFLANSEPKTEDGYPESTGDPDDLRPGSDRDQRQIKNDFYEEYFHGGDVFDKTSREIRELTGERNEDQKKILVMNLNREGQKETDPDQGRIKRLNPDRSRNKKSARPDRDRKVITEAEEDTGEDLHLLLWNRKSVHGQGPSDK